jgi:hypothetical protein
MLRRRFPFSAVFITALAPSLVISCGGPPRDDRPTTCRPAAGFGSPANIADVIALANGLVASRTEPVTLPCFLESLDRPLGALAVRSSLSLQPAVGRRSPRIFLFSGQVVMSVVPEGDGRNALELAEYTSEIRSIKGELLFPLSAPVAPAVPYDRVRFDPGIEATICSTCHPSEIPATAISFAGAYESDVLRPKKTQEIDLPFLQSETALCDPSLEADRCALLKAVFEHGELDVQHFSDKARTIFGN